MERESLALFSYKAWIHSFLVLHLSGSVPNKQNLQKPAVLIVLSHRDLYAHKAVSNYASQTK